MTHVTRRQALQHGLLAATAPWATLGLAAPGDARRPRLVLVVLRGGLDGLFAVPVPGDPAFATARAAFVEAGDAPLPLQGPFALHPALAQLHAMYGAGELAVVHATGLPYRDRSHFDAQQVLESGGTRPYELASGWLARALAPAGGLRAVALSTAPPLLLRGGDAVDTWAPSVLPEPAPDLVERLAQLYRNDAALSQALARARGLRDDGMAGMPADAAGNGRRALVLLARKAGEFLAQPQGPAVAVLESTGWDSHANQAAPQGALVNQLRLLDEALAALRSTLTGAEGGSAWPRTVVVVATEFGRTVLPNGTSGTDHGSGGAAFVLGGAVAGGRVLADWPGLAAAARFEGRDLRITTDLRSVFKGVLRDHLRLSAAALEAGVFPGSQAAAPPIQGLIRA